MLEIHLEHHWRLEGDRIRVHVFTGPSRSCVLIWPNPAPGSPDSESDTSSGFFSFSEHTYTYFSKRIHTRTHPCIFPFFSFWYKPHDKQKKTDFGHVPSLLAKKEGKGVGGCARKGHIHPAKMKWAVGLQRFVIPFVHILAALFHPNFFAISIYLIAPNVFCPWASIGVEPVTQWAQEQINPPGELLCWTTWKLFLNFFEWHMVFDLTCFIIYFS